MSLSFKALGLSEQLVRTVAKQGYDSPTDVQARAIPPLLAGRDVLATAQTGTGKTAAFLLPTLDRLAAGFIARAPRPRSAGPARRGRHGGAAQHAQLPAQPSVLVLSPTRELAAQIAESARIYGAGKSVRHAVVFGGAPKGRQLQQLGAGPDILIATPGRLVDFIGEGAITLEAVSCLILDEADRMLDMGFIHEVRRIAQSIRPERQTALFSATMPREIEALANELLVDAVRVVAAKAEQAVGTIEQEVLHVAQADKTQLLTSIIDERGVFKAIVFTRTKYKASRLAKQLVRQGIAADSIHGDKTQNQRTRALAGFQSGKLQILVATDVASRGIDVDDVSHVINYDLPNEAETYVHRIGRTGRAGADGTAISFCDSGELAYLQAIERLQKTRISVTRDHAFHVEPARPTIAAKPATGRKRTGRGANTAGTVGARPGGSAGRKPSSVNTRRKRGAVR